MMASFFRDRRKMSMAALVVAAVFFVAVNSLANALFRGATLDFTEDEVFTLSPGTLKVLSKIEEPITIGLCPIMAIGGRGKSAPSPLAAGRYTLDLLMLRPPAGAQKQSAFDLVIRSGEATETCTGGGV